MKSMYKKILNIYVQNFESKILSELRVGWDGKGKSQSRIKDCLKQQTNLYSKNFDYSSK